MLDWLEQIALITGLIIGSGGFAAFLIEERNRKAAKSEYWNKEKQVAFARVIENWLLAEQVLRDVERAIVSHHHQGMDLDALIREIEQPLYRLEDIVQDAIRALSAVSLLAELRTLSLCYSYLAHVNAAIALIYAYVAASKSGQEGSGENVQAATKALETAANLMLFAFRGELDVVDVSEGTKPRSGSKFRNPYREKSS